MIFVVEFAEDGTPCGPEQVARPYQDFDGIEFLVKRWPDAIYYTDEPEAFGATLESKANALLAEFEKYPQHSRVMVSEVVALLQEVLR